MGLFRRKKQSVVDLTKLQKRGILQKSREIAVRDKRENANSNKIIDLSNNSDNEGLGFLNNLAGAGADAGSEADRSKKHFDSLQHLKVKIDDIEYKLDKFIERLDKIEEKLEKL